MALENVLEADGGSGCGGGLVIWLNYVTLYYTAEWQLDYYHNIWDLDTVQTDALDELFNTKKGWEGAGAERYKYLYKLFIEKVYQPEFETRLSNIKGITVDAVVGAGKLINQCDDFYLSLESDDYEPEIRFGRSVDSYGVLKYDWCFKDAIINHCDAANTATEEEDKLIDQAIEKVSDVNYPEFVTEIGSLAEEKDTFIKKQKRILNYQKTFKDYTERVVKYDQDVADAYNAQALETVIENSDYAPISVVPPWEVDCANIWVATGNTDAMVDFINDAPCNATTWNAGTAQAMAIIFQYAEETQNTEVIEAFKDKYYKVEYEESEKRWVSIGVTDAYGITEYVTTEVTIDKYTAKVDPVVLRKMEPYMDRYLYGTAWTTLTEEEIQITVTRTGDDIAEIDTTFTVKKTDDGCIVTTVSATGEGVINVESSKAIEDNQWRYYGDNIPRTMRLNGATEEEIDEYINSEQGKLDLYSNPYYKLSEEEEKEAEEMINEFWSVQEADYIREYGGLETDFTHMKSAVRFEEEDSFEKNCTWEEYLQAIGFDDIDDYNHTMQYYNLEQKLSDSKAFWNGATEVPYNIGKATESVLDKMTSGCPYTGYDEYDLEIMAMCEVEEERRDLARQASKLQNPYAYGAGRASYMLVTSAVAGELLGGTGLVESAASMFGGGKVAEKVAEVVLDTVLVDIPTDTIPEAIVNYNAGMSTDEILEKAAVNVAVNAGINIGADIVLPEIVGQAAKSFNEADDVLKTSSDGLKMTDDMAEAGKSIPDVTGATKNSDIGSDIAKMADNKAVADTAADISKTSDLSKSAENVADSSKITGKTTDATKTAGNVAESEKVIGKAGDTTKTASNTADSVKTAENVADSGKTVEHVADSGKTVEHAAETEKKIDDVADATKTANNATDTVKTVEKTEESVKEAEKASDASKTVGNVAESEKAIGNAADTTKTVSNTADSVKVADTVKSAKSFDDLTDFAKAVDDGADTVKTSESVVDATKTVDNITDAGKSVEHEADVAKEAKLVDDTTETADYVADTEKEIDNSIDENKDLVSSNDSFMEDSDSVGTDLIIGSHYDLTHDEVLKEIPGEAHHIFQKAAVKDVIDEEEALCAKMLGDVTIPGSAHNKVHEYMENWWDQFRIGGSRKGETPTIREFAEATEQSFIYAGFKPDEVHELVGFAKEQYAEWSVFQTINDEFGDAVGGFTKEERKVVLSYVEANIKGGDLSSFDRFISKDIPTDKADAIFSRIDAEINYQGMDYIDDVIDSSTVDKIPKPINLLSR